MNKQLLKTARAALKAFYGAHTENDWAADNVGYRKAKSALCEAENTLMNTSLIAFETYRTVNTLVSNVVGHLEVNDLREYYIKNRESLANSLFDTIEKTLKD